MFVRLGNTLVNSKLITGVDLRNLEELVVTVFYDGETYTIEGIQAIELLMALRPSVLESRRLRWARHAWAFHNLVGHPLMQLLAFFRKYELAMWVHDATVPKPLGRRQ